MAGVCVGMASPNDCGHRTYTVTLDGQSYAVERLPDPLTPEQITAMLQLTARYLEDRGVDMRAFVNRVILGEEATNVKQYDLIGAGASVTKTNIGTAYVDVLPGANGQRALIDFAGATEYRPVLTANLIGAGPFGVRIIRDSDATVLFENALIALTGERELDPGWLPVPQGWSGLEVVRLQAKSTVGADDPVFRRCVVLVR